MVENVTAAQGFAALAEDPEAQLVDVRTEAEWNFVGLPDLRAIGRHPVLIPWQFFPSGATNPTFLEALRSAGLRPEAKIYFLCRSGARSQAAAEAAEAAGFAHCFNISDGFEGSPDAHGHRGTVSGWKAADLPWKQ